jgi:hypothetical protein
MFLSYASIFFRFSPSIFYFSIYLFFFPFSLKRCFFYNSSLTNCSKIRLVFFSSYSWEGVSRALEIVLFYFIFPFLFVSLHMVCSGTKYLVLFFVPLVLVVCSMSPKFSSTLFIFAFLLSS